jgi:hypothetical protein
MEIEDVSKSFPDDLRGYVASRLRTVPMLALVVLLLTAVWFPLLPNSIAVICLQVFLAIVLISIFRLWDDLADLNQDRIQHPDRVLSGTDHARLFQRVCILLGTTVLAVLLASGNTQASLGFSCLVILFVCFYKLPWRANWPLVSYHLLILKYPLFVILISTCDDRPINQLHLIIALLAYFLLCIYEVIHDPVLRSDTRCRLIAGTELVFAAGLVGFSLTVF